MSKYQLIERERKFLLAGKQVNTTGLLQKQITDYYLNGAMLRFRVIADEEGQQYKLTQKRPANAAGEAAITTIYLSRQEFELLNIFDAVTVSKTRHVLQFGKLVIGLDHYLTATDELWLAEVEFASTEEMPGFELPFPHIGDVTGQPEYDGYALARRFQQIN
jgi:CYTH domain-containing protein